MARNRGNQPIYDEKIASEILERLSEGESLSSICASHSAKNDKFPSRSTVSMWAINDTPEGFADRYARARMSCVMARLDKANDDLSSVTGKTYTDENGNVRVDSGHVQLSRTYADLVKWEVSKLIPQYSDRQTIEHKNAVPVQVSVSREKVKEVIEELDALTG